jgi:hypothetical protein
MINIFYKITTELAQNQDLQAKYYIPISAKASKMFDSHFVDFEMPTVNVCTIYRELCKVFSFISSKRPFV